MTPERWARISALLINALERTGEERASYLDAACADDPEVRREVESLMAYDQRAELFLDRPAADAAAAALLFESPRPDPVGRTFGHYVVESYIGAGGMGEVFMAYDERLGRRVALKILPAVEGRGTGLARRFAQEAKAASALNHPNIVTIYDVGESDGSAFIAMELIDGRTLRDHIADGPMAIEDALSTARQAAEALAAAHDAGIVHRDVKPENLMLRRDGYLKVLDFGIAKRLGPIDPGRGSRALTVVSSTPGMILGTVAYMSPEQARGLDVGPPSDVWSLGVVLYEALCGRSPFAADTASDTIAAILERTPPSLFEIRPDAPRDLEPILQRALAKSLNERYATMRAFLDDLVRVTMRAEARPLVETSEILATTSELPPSNLPIPVTSFVGRGKGVESIRAALVASRLVTLKGEGGIGKTRLAIEAARAAASDYPDGVWLVELGPIADGERVVDAVATALGVSDAAHDGPAAAIGRFLRGRRALLVLDNCEHLVEACARLASDLLRACPHLHVLATSREALGVAGEALSEVSPLSLPNAHRPPTAEDLDQSEAVQLFVERAKLVSPGFALTGENASAVAGICRQLDGLALAIELAASKVRVLSPAQILDRLDDRLALLVGGDRTALPRQRTLRATLDWSYELLSDDERVLLRRLAVFAGGWSLEAAEATVRDDTPDVIPVPQPSFAILELLTHLVDKSLVHANQRGDSVRYTMLETVRAYAREKLRAGGEEKAAVAAHARHFLGILCAPIDSPGAPPPPIEWLDDELENVRAVLAWAIEQRNAPAEGLAACVILARTTWQRRGRLAEGRGWLSLALASSPDAPTKVRMAASTFVCYLAMDQGDYAYAIAGLESALPSLRASGDEAALSEALSRLGQALERKGAYEDARIFREEALELARRLGDETRLAHELNEAGLGAMFHNDHAAAASYFTESVSIYRKIALPENVAVALHNMGENAIGQGELEDARRYLEESLDIARAKNIPRVVAYSCHVLGNLSTAVGDLDRARELILEALTIDREVGDRDGVAFVVEGLARLEAARGDACRAMRLAGAAAGVRLLTGSALAPAEQAQLDCGLEPARSALGPEDASAQYAAGLAMTFDEVVDDAARS